MGDETPTFQQALAAAYDLDQVKRLHDSAVVMLRGAIEADPSIRETAEAERGRLRGVVNARSMGEVTGCHVSKVALALLDEALR